MKNTLFVLSALAASTAMAAGPQPQASVSASQPVKSSVAVVIPNKTVQPVSKPAVAASTGLTTAATPAGGLVVPTAPLQGNNVNPFTGTTLSYEQAKMILETARLETSIYEERVKQAGLQGDLNNAPLKKKAEAEAAQTSVVRERALQVETGSKIGGGGKLPSAGVSAPEGSSVASKPIIPKKIISKPVVPVVKKSSVTVNNKAVTATEATLPVAAQPAAVPLDPVTEVQSIISVGSTRSAILSLNQGGMAVYADGVTTPWGKIEVNADHVTLNGRSYKVHNATLGRFAQEKLPAKEGSTAAAATTSNVPVPVGGPVLTVPPTSSQVAASNFTPVKSGTSAASFNSSAIPGLPPAIPTTNR